MQASQIASIAADLISLASKGDLASIREMLDYNLSPVSDLTLSWKTCHVAHSTKGLIGTDYPTILYDGGASPEPPPSLEKERATQLVSMIESLMEAAGSTIQPPPVDRGMLRDLMLDVAAAASRVQSQEPRLLEIPMSCYVLGDLHGNLADLQFFRRALWPAGVSAQAADFLFLGDFVDRGLDGVPVIAYMMAQKVLHPQRWWMIRGNHETREVNGNIKTYREGSFLHQCCRIFGEDEGRLVWDRVNDFFDTLPLAARVAQQVFCVHGGLPRELCQPLARLEDINDLPCPLKFVRRGDMVHSMLWSDPIPPEREEPTCQDSLVLDSQVRIPPPLFLSANVLRTIIGLTRACLKQGFGLSSRGCSCFGEKTLDIFLEQHNIKFVFRGHEAQQVSEAIVNSEPSCFRFGLLNSSVYGVQHGIGLSKSARLCTIFSTSKDHFAADTKTTCG